MRARFLERRDLIVRLLNEVPGVTCTTPGGAFYAWPNVTEACRRTGCADSEAFRKRLLHEAGIAVLADIHFGRRVPGDGQHIRFSYAASNDGDRERRRAARLRSCATNSRRESRWRSTTTRVARSRARARARARSAGADRTTRRALTRRPTSPRTAPGPRPALPADLVAALPRIARPTWRARVERIDVARRDARRGRALRRGARLHASLGRAQESARGRVLAGVRDTRLARRGAGDRIASDGRARCIGITGCFCAIAETGTLVFVTGTETPTATFLLPETHVADRARRPDRRRHGRSVRARRRECGDCRARSTSCRGRRAPATSSRRSCSARTVRAGMHIVLVG